jgi:hypothetical protein
MLAAMRRRLLAISSVALLSACGNDSPGLPAFTPGTAAGGAVGGSGGVPMTSSSTAVGAGGDLVATGGTATFAGATGAGGTTIVPPIAGGAGGVPVAAGGAGGASGTPNTGGAATGGDGPYIPPPGALPDITYTMESTVAPGGEALMCIYVAMPTNRGVIAVPSAESQFTPGSHHLLAYRTDLTSIPVGTTTAPFPCADGAWMVHERGSYYEAQTPMSRRDLPPGVAHRFQPGEVVVIQTHYLNPATDPLDAHAQLTLHTVDVSTVPQEAGSIMFTNVNISVPPGGTARSTMSCTLPSDFNPALLWSHMHKQGVNFIATTDDPTAVATLGTLYHEMDWDEPHPRSYPYSPPATLHAGTHITFSCDYNNPTSRTLTFGQSAETNEMCILHGMYWPRMTSSGELCTGGKTSHGAIPADPSTQTTPL